MGFQDKTSRDGSIDTVQGQSSGKRFTQIKGIDYKETFSYVMRFTFICLLLTLVAHLDLKLFHMDVKTIFLNGNLEKDTYINQPIGFVTKGQEG